MQPPMLQVSISFEARRSHSISIYVVFVVGVEAFKGERRRLRTRESEE